MCQAQATPTRSLPSGVSPLTIIGDKSTLELMGVYEGAAIELMSDCHPQIPTR
jgi:hypothetical protein